MTDIFEQAIATYLTLDGQAFLAPQFNVVFNKELNEGGACPDFVVLDSRRHEVVVVEVATAANLDPLFERVQSRHARWFNPLRSHLEPLGFASEHWKTIRFLGFVRYPNYTRAKARFSAVENVDVAFYPVEAATFGWEYWEDRIQGGLPDRNTRLRQSFLDSRT